MHGCSSRTAPASFAREVVDGSDQQPSSGRSGRHRAFERSTEPLRSERFRSHRVRADRGPAGADRPRRRRGARRHAGVQRPQGEAQEAAQAQDHHRRRFGRGGARRRGRRVRVVRGRPGGQGAAGHGPADRLRGAGHVRRDGVGVRQPATCRVGERHARGGRHRGRGARGRRRRGGRGPDAVHRGQRRAGQGGEPGGPGHRGGQERRGPGPERRERRLPRQVRRPAGRRERPSPGASRRRGRQGGRGSGGRVVRRRAGFLRRVQRRLRHQVPSSA